MKTSIFLLTLGMILLTGSCQSNPEDKAKEPVNNTHTEEHDTHGHTDQQLQLNDGERWEADASTKTGIAEMQSLVADYKNGTIDKVSTLLKQLKGSFSDIFAQCSMKGPAHDQLHNYLFPMKDLFALLEDCEEAACTTTVDQLEKHLERFSTYFQ